MASVNSYGDLVSVTIPLVLVLYAFTSYVAVLAAPMKEPVGVLVELIPKYSKNSPLYSGNLTKVERYARMVQLSNRRASRLTSQLDYAITQRSQPNLVTPKVFQVFDSIFLVSVKIGRVGQFYLDLDTGSDLIWVQSSDCNPCFPCALSYNRFQSTFGALSVHDPQCGPQTRPDPRGICTYDEAYGEGSTTRGLIGKDNFQAYSRDTGRWLSAGRLLFGVAQANVGFVWGANAGPINVIAGMFGMGRGPRSFISQYGLSQRIPRSFSYCLGYWDAEDPPPTYLKVGAYASEFPSGSVIKSTPLVQHQGADASLYFVNLLDISVGGETINIPDGFFRIHADGRNGIIFDTGTPVIHIFEDAFELLDDFLTSIFENAGLHRYIPSKEDMEKRTELGFCWTRVDEDGKLFDDFPVITLHLDGADMDIDTDGAYVIFEKFFCVAIVPITDPGGGANVVSVLGSLSMTNYYFMHDLTAMRLSFAKTVCSTGHP